MYLETDLAKALRNKAGALGLTQAELAKRIGVVQSAMVLVLRGISRPNKATLPKYARFLALPLARVRTMAGGQHQHTTMARVEPDAPPPRPFRPVRSSTAARPTLAAVLDLADDPLAWAAHRAPVDLRGMLKKVLAVD